MIGTFSEFKSSIRNLIQTLEQLFNSENYIHSHEEHDNFITHLEICIQNLKELDSLKPDSELDEFKQIRIKIKDPLTIISYTLQKNRKKDEGVEEKIEAVIQTIEELQEETIGANFRKKLSSLFKSENQSQVVAPLPQPPATAGSITSKKGPNTLTFTDFRTGGIEVIYFCKPPDQSYYIGISVLEGKNDDEQLKRITNALSKHGIDSGTWVTNPIDKLKSTFCLFGNATELNNFLRNFIPAVEKIVGILDDKTLKDMVDFCQSQPMPLPQPPARVVVYAPETRGRPADKPANQLPVVALSSQLLAAAEKLTKNYQVSKSKAWNKREGYTKGSWTFSGGEIIGFISFIKEQNQSYNILISIQGTHDLGDQEQLRRVNLFISALKKYGLAKKEQISSVETQLKNINHITLKSTEIQSKEKLISAIEELEGYPIDDKNRQDMLELLQSHAESLPTAVPISPEHLP